MGTTISRSAVLDLAKCLVMSEGPDKILELGHELAERLGYPGTYGEEATARIIEESCRQARRVISLKENTMGVIDMIASVRAENPSDPIHPSQPLGALVDTACTAAAKAGVRIRKVTVEPDYTDAMSITLGSPLDDDGRPTRHVNDLDLAVVIEAFDPESVAEHGWREPGTEGHIDAECPWGILHVYWRIPR